MDRQLIPFLVAQGRQRAAGRRRSFLIAPTCGVIVLVLIWGDVPLRARWAASRPAFEDTLERGVMEDSGGDRVQRLGHFEIDLIIREDHGAVIFYERTGAGLDDAGFAYLPDGPFPELENGTFERPRFNHLGGRWYAWTASW